MKTFAKTVLKIALSALILFLIIKKIDEKILLRVLGQARVGWLLWAVAWFVFSKVLSAWRFRDLLSAEGVRLSNRSNLRLYWLGMYYNLLLPGGISGDGYKIKLLMDAYGASFRRMFAVSLLDRLSGLVALGQLALLLALGLPLVQPWWWAVGLALVASVVVAWQLSCRLDGQQGKGHRWLRTALQSLAVQAAQTVCTLGILLALGVAPGQWLAYSVLFLVSSVAATLPLTIGGAGARELTFLWGAALLHTDAEQAVAIGFVFYLISTAVSLTGMAFSFQQQPLPVLPTKAHLSTNHQSTHSPLTNP